MCKVCEAIGHGVGCNSFFIVERATNNVVMETFNKDLIYKVNFTNYKVFSAGQWLRFVNNNKQRGYNPCKYKKKRIADFAAKQSK